MGPESPQRDFQGDDHMRKNIRRSAVVGGTVAAVFGVGIAFAAWTTYGEGDGAVTAGSAQLMTVNVTGVGGLVPTKSVNVPFTVTNPNPYKVQLSDATLENVVVASAPNGPNCDPAVVTGSSVPLTDLVAANGGASPSHNFPVTMSNLAHNDCQGAVFTVTLKVNGLSN